MGGISKGSAASGPCCKAMWDLAFYLFLIVLLGAAVVLGSVLLRAYQTGTSPTAALFGPRPERRLDVVDHSSVDGKRRLVLIRRDDVEHLIMTGGPVDVVIETGIKAPYSRVAEHVDGQQAPIFTRQPRGFGQAAGET